MKTHYEILGVPETASNEEITRAFRKAAMNWHPDRNRGNEQAAGVLFKQATDAKVLLLDQRTRADYDRSLSARRAPPAPSKTSAPPARPPAPQKPQSATAPPAHPQPSPPQPQPQPQPGQSGAHATVDRDIWLGMALGFATQGADAVTVAAALTSRGCPAVDADHVARQAVDMQPTSTTFQQASTANSPTPPKSPTTSSFVLPLLGLVVLAGFLLMLVKLSSTKATEPVPAAAASAAANYVLPVPGPQKTWSSQLPTNVVNFDEATGKGEVRYASFPASEEFGYFREKQSEVFEIRLLQTVPMPGNRKLLLFSSQPSDFGCHACHPLLSAMLVKAENGKPYTTVLPLQILGTAGRFGSVSLEGDRRVSLLKVGPRRDGFVFKDGDAGQGSIVEWGNLFSIEKERFRSLGTFHVHEDSFGSGFCEEPKKALCAQKDTSIRFARGDSAGDYFDILATETKVDPYTGNGLPSSRSYVLRFNGDQYVEVALPSAQAPSASAPSPPDIAGSTPMNP